METKFNFKSQKWKTKVYRSNGGLIMKMWIARASGGLLTLHTSEPRKIKMGEESEDYFWASDIETQSFLNRHLFPEVTFENSPMKVELKLIEK